MSLIRNGGTAPADVSRVVHTLSDVSGPDPLQVQAADIFAEQLAAGTVPPIRAIRSTLRVGQPRAQQIQTYLAAIARI